MSIQMVVVVFKLVLIVDLTVDLRFSLPPLSQNSSVEVNAANYRNKQKNSEESSNYECDISGLLVVNRTGDDVENIE